MDKKGNKEIRFVISNKKHKELTDEAKSLSIPLATLIKLKIFKK
jgi:hypothetical protein